MAQLGANAYGEVLEAGRVPDCYFGLRLDSVGDSEPVGVLVVAPSRCCILQCRSRTGTCYTSW